MQNRFRWLRRLFISAQLILVLLVVREWMYVGTYRFYVEDRIEPASQDGSVWQQFNIQDRRVVPQIVTEGNARLKFAVQFPTPTELWMDTRPSDRASYEIHLVENGARRLLARRTLNAPGIDRVLLPACNGILEIASQGSLTWSDLRIVRGSRLMPYHVVVAILLLLSLLFSLRLGRSQAARAASDRNTRPVLLFAGIAIGGSCVLTLILIEAAMRWLGPPAAISAITRELGEVAQDPQWDDSAQYGMRLRPNLDSALAWQDGDIVRMGFIPPTNTNREKRYPLHTDAEGFRNPEVRDPIQVAVLGDSFTDALTVPLDQIWTTGLERRLNQPVQNYGTAGFGPQQELRVLSNYAIHHHPRIVLVAFFAGNDIFNAEAFAKAEKSHGSISPPRVGWKIKKIVARYDTFYSLSLVRVALYNLEKLIRKTSISDDPAGSDGDDQNDTDATARSVTGPTFNDGIFTIPVNHRKLQFALMPPYLQTLTFSADELEQRQGWQATRSTLLEMNRISRANGSMFAVLFIPFKSQVYLPLLERSFSAKDLAEAFRFYFRQQPVDLNLKEMTANRLAQNELMRRFCDDAHIPLIDLTSTLQAQVESGRNMYFTDDSHWNAAGQELAADAVADFFKQEGLLTATTR